MEIKEVKTPGYELVKHAIDNNTGLDAIIAIHSTQLGNPVGGLRIKKFKHHNTHLDETLGLAKAMTFKCAAAGIGFGGSKCVINIEPERKSRPLLESMAEFLNEFNDKLPANKQVYTGTNMGTDDNDIAILSEKSPYILGTADKSGNPSPMTALGVYRSILECVRYMGEKIRDKTSLVQGIGNVGYSLADMLYNDCKQLIISEEKEERVHKFTSEHPRAMVANPTSLFNKGRYDIFVPCATGNILDYQTIHKLHDRDCRLVAGSANNQLKNDVQAYTLKSIGILYAPDFIINAGGLLSVVSDLTSWTKQELEKKVVGISNRVIKAIKLADTNRISTHEAAMQLALERLA